MLKISLSHNQSARINKLNRIIFAINIPIQPVANRVFTDKPAHQRSIISRSQIVVTRFGITILTAIARRICVLITLISLDSKCVIFICSAVAVIISVLFYLHYYIAVTVTLIQNIFIIIVVVRYNPQAMKYTTLIAWWLIYT